MVDMKLASGQHGHSVAQLTNGEVISNYAVQPSYSTNLTSVWANAQEERKWLTPFWSLVLRAASAQ